MKCQERRRCEIESALAAEGITCSGMREIDPRMEEAFISLIRRQGCMEGRAPAGSPMEVGL